MTLPHAFAHTKPNSTDTDQWEPLEKHLHDVEARAEQFAAQFNAGEWGALVGLWHDLGKYSREFQAYLLSANGLEAHIETPGKVDHSTAGAKHVVAELKKNHHELLVNVLAYVIAGHHAGLADYQSSGESSLLGRLNRNVDDWQSYAPPSLIKPRTIQLPIPALFKIPVTTPKAPYFRLSTFTRMLFSCLVDADALATEAFSNPEQSSRRSAEQPSLKKMRDGLNTHLDDMARGAVPGTVTNYRQEILADCRQAAQLRPGFFSLTVPTGGGKTLSSLAFALEHAVRYDKSRVIYAIPFTSIIEQTAEVFRTRVFAELGPDVVVEHHSNVEPHGPGESANDADSRQARLATENWAAPLIVTTNVQLLESLFACRTSRCRKLHNVVGSVIILDEAQALPPRLLRPCLAMLDELVTCYGCTIVFCTATQPAIEHRDDFPIGIKTDRIQEIVRDSVQLSANMRRVTIQSLGTVSDAEVVDRMCGHDSFLTIVNTKPHAAKLYQDLAAQLGADGLFHLSTHMCAAHRAKHLDEIRKRLKSGQSCRVVSTQLIEAGVDVDFPVVFRSLAGLDSIAQAAGRCNREGRRRADESFVYVFKPAEVKLFGDLRFAADAGSEFLDEQNLLAPETLSEFFSLHYLNTRGPNNWDGSGDDSVMNRLCGEAWDFRTAAANFRLIEEAGPTIFIPYDERGKQLCSQLVSEGPSRALLRQLQRYTVTVYESQFRSYLPDILLVGGVNAQYAVLSDSSRAYSDEVGLRIEQAGILRPESCIL